MSVLDNGAEILMAGMLADDNPLLPRALEARRRSLLTLRAALQEDGEAHPSVFLSDPHEVDRLWLSGLPFLIDDLLGITRRRVVEAMSTILAVGREHVHVVIGDRVARYGIHDIKAMGRSDRGFVIDHRQGRSVFPLRFDAKRSDDVRAAVGWRQSPPLRHSETGCLVCDDHRERPRWALQ